MSTSEIISIISLVIGLIVLSFQIIHSFRLEKVKNQLGLNSQKQMRVFDDEKESIYKFYDLMNKWILWLEKSDYELLFESKPVNVVDDLLGKIIDFTDIVFSHKNRLDLLVNNTGLKKQIEEMYVNYIAHQNTIRRHLNYISVNINKNIRYIHFRETGVDELYEFDGNYTEREIEMSELLNVIIPEELSKFNTEEDKYSREFWLEFNKFKKGVNYYFNHINS
jgi:hypothetical protein